MNLALALGPERDTYVGAEAATQGVLDAAHLGRRTDPALHPRPALGCAAAAHAIFHFTHRQALGHGLAREICRDFGVLEGEQGARVRPWPKARSEEHTSELQSHH